MFEYDCDSKAFLAGNAAADEERGEDEVEDEPDDECDVDI